ncbi:hypothetical protein HDU85_003592 [Gaertneriomyces sp. JEL0708]|nr:hypothetical protein HDU85_003592 [Gaertneriomyces sp. JEL0708]
MPMKRVGSSSMVDNGPIKRLCGHKDGWTNVKEHPPSVGAIVGYVKAEDSYGLFARSAEGDCADNEPSACPSPSIKQENIPERDGTTSTMFPRSSIPPHHPASKHPDIFGPEFRRCLPEAPMNACQYCGHPAEQEFLHALSSQDYAAALAMLTLSENGHHHEPPRPEIPSISVDELLEFDEKAITQQHHELADPHLLHPFGISATVSELEQEVFSNLSLGFEGLGITLTSPAQERSAQSSPLLSEELKAIMDDFIDFDCGSDVLRQARTIGGALLDE